MPTTSTASPASVLVFAPPEHKLVQQGAPRARQLTSERVIVVADRRPGVCCPHGGIEGRGGAMLQARGVVKARLR
jgi:hypothetical protein